MMNRVFLILILLLISFFAIGQADSSFSKPSYFLSLHAGGLLGKKGYGSSLTSALLQGVRYRGFTFGVGIGYDAYAEYRAIPVFGSLGCDLASVRMNAFFIQVDGGYSKAWNLLEDETFFSYAQKAGTYFHPLVGYRIHNGKMNVYLTAGYKFQRIAFQQTPNWLEWGLTGNRVTIQHDIQRLSVQIGFGFH